MNPIIDKLTSTNVAIKWNDVIKIKNLNKYYKIEYYQKQHPNIVDTIENINKSEIIINKLKQNTNYVVQLSINQTSNQENDENEENDDDDYLKQVISIGFKTLLNDIPEPKGLLVTRIEADKVNVKWDPIQSSSLKNPLRRRAATMRRRLWRTPRHSCAAGCH